jgi:hypothetical protein
MKMIIERTSYSKKQTTGKMRVYDEKGKEIFTCCTLELPDKNNQSRVSCIPHAEYTVKRRVSQKYGNHFHIQDVPNRDFILIHTGNFYYEILGCVLVGDTLSDINGDGYKDIINSKKTMSKLLEIMPNSFKLEIKRVEAPKAV